MPAKFKEGQQKRWGIMIRLKKEEHEELEAIIAREGHSDKSTFCRETVLARIRGAEASLPKGTRAPVKKLAEVVGVWKALGPYFPQDKPKTTKETTPSQTLAVDSPSM